MSALARFARGYAVTLRPYLLFVSGAAGLLGLALAPPIAPALFAGCFAAFFLSYGFGQALTDVFQTDTDALSSPYRPLVRGEIGRGAVFATSLAGLLLCGALLSASNPRNLVLAGAAVAGLLAYSPLKRRWWGGPPCNAFVVSLLTAMGLLCGEPSPARALRDPLLPPALLAVYASYAVFVLLGYLKDVEADRATGYDTFAVRFSRRSAVVVSALHAAVALAASALLVTRGIPRLDGARWFGAALWLAGAGLLAGAHLLARRVERDADAHPAIALSVRAFVLVHLGAAAMLRPPFLLLVLPLLILQERALARRPCREQV